MTIFTPETNQSDNSRIIYPFVKFLTKTTKDITSDAQIITQLTAAENSDSLVEKITIYNPMSNEAFISCYFCTQSDETPSGETPEIAYRKLIQNFRIEPYKTTVIDTLQDTILAPNNFLMLETEDISQKVDVYVSQIVLNNSGVTP